MFKRKAKKKIEFNTTALPDIIFMLLFFFMVVTVLKEDSANWKMQLPETEYASYLKKHDGYLNVGLSLEGSNALFLFENNSYTEIKDLEARMQKKLNAGMIASETKIKLKIDKGVEMQFVNQLKTMMQKLQLYQVEYIINHTKV